MTGQPIAILMARQPTVRALTEPVPESIERGPRRVAARALLAAAVRLDPGLAAAR